MTDEILERFAHQNEVVDDLQELVRGFYNELNEVIEKENPPAIWNMDDVGITFEPLITKTLNYKGDRNVGILSLQAHHKRMTFILMISSTGAIAPPVLLYYSKGFQQFSIEEFPEVLITNNSRGYNTEDTNYNEVLPHFLRFIEPNSMLLLDECKGHRSERISLLLKERRIRCIRLPGGTTPFLQPVDSSIGKFVKNEVRAQFIKWCTDNIDEITAPEGRRRKSFRCPTNQLMAKWIMEGVKKLKPELIIGSFMNTGVLSKDRQDYIINNRLPKCFVNKDQTVKPENAEIKITKEETNCKQETN